MGAQDGRLIEGWDEDGQNRIHEMADEWDAAGVEETAVEGAGFRKRFRRGGYRLTGSMAARIVAFFLLAASCLVGFGGALVCLYLRAQGIYTENLNTVMLNMMYGECSRLAYDAMEQIERGELEAAKALCREQNLELELIELSDDGEVERWSTWKTYSGRYSMKLTTDIYMNYVERGDPVRLRGKMLEDGELYIMRVYVNPSFPYEDNLKNIAEDAERIFEVRYSIPATASAGIFLCLICFLFLMCSAGHRNGRSGIVPGALTSLHLDVLTVLFGGVALLFLYLLLNVFPDMDTWTAIVAMTGTGTLLVVWMTFYFMDFAIRVKLGKCWRYSLIFILMRGLWRVLRFVGRELAGLAMGLPLIVTTLNIYFGICIIEFIIVIRYMRRSEGIVLWFLVKLILLPFIMYLALEFRRLVKASSALAQGQEDYRVDTARMFGVFREHGENLNSLGLGISRAVEERTRSERMKTELISNVSHDLKTPLTSIINYADLIWEEVNGERSPGRQAAEAAQGRTEDGECQSRPADSAAASVDNGKVKEYAEVLLRQSRRLKKLMEDLMEASKATTGNLEVVLEPCEVGVLLSQAVGEYQQKMAEKDLELIARQPEASVTILADGRRLWRIFENLLNNICKYAQEKSRVYLNVEVREAHVLIIFRNMSKYPLDIPGEELEERFVRGDKSRHMEGNGLGLSIAKSLAELQHGQMEIVTDGDLFKVVLRFPLFNG